MDIRRSIGLREKTVSPHSSIETDSGTLCINCKDCDKIPDCCSPECISCMCEAVFEHGSADRIRMVSAKDIEISGKATELICSLARIRRPLIQDPKGRRCSRCQRRPSVIIDHAWSSFPDPNFDSACSRLYSDRDDGIECTACMQRTFNAVSSAKSQMSEIDKRFFEDFRIREGFF